MSDRQTLYWLYDWFGRFLDHNPDADQVFFRAMPIAGGAVPGISLTGLSNRLAVGDAVRLTKAISAPLPLPSLSSEATGIGGVALRITDDQGPYGQFNGKMLGTRPEADGIPEYNRPHIMGWETFLPLTPAEALGLDLLCTDGALELTLTDGKRVGAAHATGELCIALNDKRVSIPGSLDTLTRIAALPVGDACEVTLALQDGVLALTCKRVK